MEEEGAVSEPTATPPTASRLAVAPLHLERFLPIRDVRKLIWAKLTPHELELVRCAQNSQRKPEMDWMEFAAYCGECGFLSLILWAIDITRDGATRTRLLYNSWVATMRRSAMLGAARYGRVNVLKRILMDDDLSKRPHEASELYLEAAYANQLEVLRVLNERPFCCRRRLKHGSCWTSWYPGIEGNLCRIAASNGNLEILRWLKENGAHWCESTYAAAAKNPIVFRWLNENKE
jgi:hypothetical protein